MHKFIDSSINRVIETETEIKTYYWFEKKHRDALIDFLN